MFKIIVLLCLILLIQGNDDKPPDEKPPKDDEKPPKDDKKPDEGKKPDNDKNPNDEQNPDPESDVYKTLDPGELPFAVYIPEGRCAGTLVKLDTVMSSGQCFLAKKYEGWDVLANLKNIKEKSSAQSRKIKSVLFYPEFRNKMGNTSIPRYFHDIARAVLETPFDQSNDVRPALIISQNEDEFKKDWLYNILDNHVPCFTMGWDCDDVKCEGKDSGVRKTVTLVNIGGNLRCENRNPRGEISMCKKGEVVLKAIGKIEDIVKSAVYIGDSGAPLVCGGIAYGVNTKSLYYKQISNDVSFVLFWPYLEYFGTWTAKAYSSPLFIQNSMFLLTSFLYLYR